MINNKIQGLFKGILPDSRLEKRAEKITTDMLNFGKVIVNRFGQNQADKIGAYRMLSNTRIDYKDLAQGLYRDVSKNNRHSHLLCIQDTSVINLTSHKDLFAKDDPDIGAITKKGNVGFFCHPMLVIDPINQIPLGLSSLELLNRSLEQKNKYERKYKSLPIEEKESFRWIKSVNQTKEVLANIPSLTIVGDRKSDIYEEMVMVPDSQTNLLIRLTHNRRLYDNPELLFDVLSQSSKKTEFSIEIKSNSKRQNRIAKIEVRYVKVKIQ